MGSSPTAATKSCRGSEARRVAGHETHRERACGSMGERLLRTQENAGSSPARSTSGPVVQREDTRLAVSQSGFDSLPVHQEGDARTDGLKSAHSVQRQHTSLPSSGCGFESRCALQRRKQCPRRRAAEVATLSRSRSRVRIPPWVPDVSRSLTSEYGQVNTAPPRRGVVDAPPSSNGEDARLLTSLCGFESCRGCHMRPWPNRIKAQVS